MSSATDRDPNRAELDDHGLGADALAILSNLTAPVWLFDVITARIVWANRAALGLWEAETLEELASRDLDGDISVSTAERIARFSEKFEHADLRLDEVWTIFPHGRPKTLRLVFTPHRLPTGRMAVLFEAVTFVADAPERVRSTDALFHTPVMISLYGRDGDPRPLYRNTAALASIESLGQSFAQRFVDVEDHRRLSAMLESFGHAVITARVKTARGVRWHELSARPCLDAVSGRAALLVSETDVTALKTAEERVRFLAEHDTLTGLPNRTLLQREVIRRIGALHSGSRLALLFIDLDRFKTINDSLGHQTGDALLIEASLRLRRTVDVDDFVARLGGDEFLVCLELGPDGRRDHELAAAILASFERPMVIGGRDLVVSASVGISRYPDDGEDLDTLMRHADLAMYAAKEQGRNRSAAFHRRMTEVVEAQLTMDSCLRRALDRGELELWYQPRVAVTGDRIVGAEALLRWRHPTDGLILPGVFIPHAEKSDLINRIGDFVIREAAARQRALADAGHDVTLSINISGRQLRDARLIDRVCEIIDQTGCDPTRLQIEITESILVGDDPVSTGALKRFADLGFTTAIDDFGTGFSNLAMLQRHPIDVLKIDRAFVSSLSSHPEIAELIIGLCRLLDLGMVAEGVETEQQLAWLAARHCDEYQGYLFSPAVPAEDFTALLDRQRRILDGRDGADADHPPLWTLVPMVEEPGDLDWASAASPVGKVSRLTVPNGRRARI